MAFSNTIGKTYTNKKFELNVAKFKEGMVFKNYKELCSFLDIPVESSDSKESTLKELRRRCEISKNPTGKDYTIGMIYDEPQNLLEMESYRMLIRDLLCDQMVSYYKETNQTIFYQTVRELTYNLNFANENYINYSHSHSELALFFDLPEEITELFFRETTQKITANIVYSLEWLKKKSMILYNKVFMIYKNGEYVEADNQETQFILDAINNSFLVLTEKRKEARKERKPITGMQDILLMGLWKEFHEAMYNYFIDHDAGFTEYYKSYKIQFTSLIEKSIKRLDILQLSKEKYKELNNRFIKSFEESTKKNIEKYNNMDFKDKSYPSNEWFIVNQYLDDYPEYREKLKNVCLSDEAERVVIPSRRMVINTNSL